MIEKREVCKSKINYLILPAGHLFGRRRRSWLDFANSIADRRLFAGNFKNTKVIIAKKCNFILYFWNKNTFFFARRPKINGEVTVEVQSTVNMRYLSYQVLGRGDIIVAKTLEIPNLMSYTFSFLASFAMVPKAQVIVHYVKGDEIVSDHLQIDFDNDLQNYVRINLPDESEVAF